MAEKVELSKPQYDLLLQTMDLKDDGKANGSYHGPQKMSGKSSWYHLSDKEYASLNKALGHKAKPHLLTKAEADFAAKTRLAAKQTSDQGKTPDTDPAKKPETGGDNSAGGTNNVGNVNSSGNDRGDDAVGNSTSLESGFDALLNAYGDQEAIIAKAMNDLKSADPSDGKALFKAQQAAEAASRLMNMITNISKTLHETMQSVIRNFRS